MKEEIARFELEREGSRILLRLSLTVMFFEEKIKFYCLVKKSL